MTATAGRLPCSGSDEPRIEAARESGVGRTLNDRTAVSEDRECMFPTGEAEQKLIEADFAVRLEAFLLKMRAWQPLPASGPT